MKTYKVNFLSHACDGAPINAEAIVMAGSPARARATLVNHLCRVIETSTAKPTDLAETLFQRQNMGEVLVLKESTDDQETAPQFDWAEADSIDASHTDGLNDQQPSAWTGAPKGEMPEPLSPAE